VFVMRASLVQICVKLQTTLTHTLVLLSLIIKQHYIEFTFHNQTFITLSCPLGFPQLLYPWKSLFNHSFSMELQIITKILGGMSSQIHRNEEDGKSRVQQFSKFMDDSIQLFENKSYSIFSCNLPSTLITTKSL
jgi:hypothetical protein